MRVSEVYSCSHKDELNWEVQASIERPDRVLLDVRTIDELQVLYDKHEITPDKEVFPYCAIGGRSGYVWFVLKYLLGYPNVRNYDGSWNEWSRLPDAAIEK